MPDIVLSTLNARYIHAAFGLRYLYANLGDLQSEAAIREFTIAQRPVDIAEAILAENPKVVGLGIYIWNADLSLQLVRTLKQLKPDLKIILGGPEVSYETESQEVIEWADYVVTGEGEVTFHTLCTQLLAGKKPLLKVHQGTEPKLDTLIRPYNFYTDEDIKNRVLYVEASRGCPYRCEFCLSSLDKTTRTFPLDDFLADMQVLLDRGARQFKFVDRTFNLNIGFSIRILEFFLERYVDGLFLHFEMIPDRLPQQLREFISRYPKGSLQFEIGVQTLDPEVQKRISRKQDMPKLEANFKFIDEHTGVHTHADLIIGLPGETMDSFGHGLNQLTTLKPDEIQVGILKRLRGAPVNRHTTDWGMVYNQNPPYDVLQTGAIDFETMQRLKRFARYWDLIVNSGNFKSTIQFLWSRFPPFESFLALSDWLFETTQAVHKISLDRLVQLLLRYLTEELSLNRDEVGPLLLGDYTRIGRKPPKSLYEFTTKHKETQSETRPISKLPKRQARHALN